MVMMLLVEMVLSVDDSDGNGVDVSGGDGVWSYLVGHVRSASVRDVDCGRGADQLRAFQLSLSRSQSTCSL